MHRQKVCFKRYKFNYGKKLPREKTTRSKREDNTINSADTSKRDKQKRPTEETSRRDRQKRPAEETSRRDRQKNK